MTARDVINGRAAWAVDRGDALDWVWRLPKASVHCACTSPPYYRQREYLPAGHPDKCREIGNEPTVGEFVDVMVELFRGVRRALHPSGTVWLNLGDKYEDKQLLGVPWRVAFALQSDGWYLRTDVIWHKPGPMPESAADRPGRCHEYVFLLAAGPDYYYDREAVKEPQAESTMTRFAPGRAEQRPAPKSRDREKSDRAEAAGRMPSKVIDGGRNMRSVWTVPSFRLTDAHFAAFPPRLAGKCILAGTSERGVCPACGAPWTRVVESERVRTRPGVDTKVPGFGAADGRQLDTFGKYRTKDKSVGHRDPYRHVTTTRTVGWEPGCRCVAGEPAPAVVCDPFVGSGTTLMVARELRRRGVGCDLSEDYVRMSRERVGSVIPGLI